MVVVINRDANLRLLTSTALISDSSRATCITGNPLKTPYQVQQLALVRSSVIMLKGEKKNIALSLAPIG